MENTVETNMEQQAVQDDAVLEPMQEQEEQPISSLDEITDQPEEQQQDEDQQTESDQQPAKADTGWMRRKMEAYASKQLKEQETRLRAEFAEMLAPLRESMYERQADDLVASGQIKSKEMALKYVKAMAGITSSEPDQQPKTQTQPRTPDGRFASSQQQQTEPDAETKARARILAEQADKIKSSKGLDVAALFRTDPEVKEKVLSGEWDFYDVAEAMSQPRRRVPSPVRSSNSAMAAVDANAVANLSDAQFDRLLKNLSEGKVYDMRR
jgi:hypothetical protein